MDFQDGSAINLYLGISELIQSSGKVGGARSEGTKLAWCLPYLPAIFYSFSASKRKTKSLPSHELKTTVSDAM